MRNALIRSLAKALANDPGDAELRNVLDDAMALRPEDDLARLRARLAEVHAAMETPRAPADMAGLMAEVQRLEALIRDAEKRLVFRNTREIRP